MRFLVGDIEAAPTRKRSNGVASVTLSKHEPRWIMRSTTNLVRRSIKICVIAGLAISLSGCAGFMCGGFQPTYVSKDDQLTEGTARSILKNNEYGARMHCPTFKPKGGWF